MSIRVDHQIRQEDLPADDASHCGWERLFELGSSHSRFRVPIFFSKFKSDLHVSITNSVHPKAL